MRTAHWTEIIVEPNRHRQDFDPRKQQEITQSIREHGLIHLPVCRMKDDRVVLVAGERRLRAMADIIQEDGTAISYHHTVLPIGHVPYALWEDLDWEKAKEIELEENVSRADLTWQEHAKAVAELHSFKKSVDPTWTTADTERMVRNARLPVTTKTHEELRLAENLEDQDVLRARSREEAIKILKRKMEREFAAEIGRMMEEQMPEYKAIQTDGMRALEEIIPESVDVFLTDPPYGINAHNFDAGLQVNHDYSDDPIKVHALEERFAQLSYRVAKPQAHLYMFCDIRRFFSIAGVFDFYDWDVWPRPLIWHKDVGHIPKPNYGPRLQYECILYANKGNKPVTGLFSDVLTHPAVQVKEHAAQKPTSLFVDLLRRSCVGGELVVDPFCGSGTVFAAAIAMGCAAVGFDTDPMCIGLSKETIRKCLEMKKQNPLL